MKARKTVSYKIARSAKNGRFVTKKHAERYPKSTVVETLKRYTTGKKG